jgi:hypothetical protein
MAATSAIPAGVNWGLPCAVVVPIAAVTLALVD